MFDEVDALAKRVAQRVGINLGMDAHGKAIWGTKTILMAIGVTYGDQRQVCLTKVTDDVEKSAIDVADKLRQWLMSLEAA